VLTSAPPVVSFVSTLRHPLRAFRREPERAAAAFLALFTVVGAVFWVLAPWLADWSTFGFHDWDVQTSHRYLVKKSLLEFHELPLWNPYACGGFPAWGFVEGGTILVSPWLFAYLVLPMSVALRVEVLGMGLISAIGAYAAASRFTKAHAARALVAALWAVNGRWALQAAAGHTWHLAYAYLPWALFFFERARDKTRPRVFLDVALLGCTFAGLVYSGGIYPLPHTVFVLGLYALVLGLLEKTLRPLFVLGVSGLLGVALSAPKLLPMLDVFKRAPRLLPSTESLDIGALLTLLIHPGQSFGSRPARVPAYGWHEWGMYISVAGLVILILGFALVQGRREAALKVVGFLLVVLGLGAFHPWAPWTLMHEYLPVFKSQHVPSRFLYPAVLVLGLIAASGLGRFIERASRKRPWLDLVLVGCVGALSFNVATVAQKPMKESMWMVPPDNIPRDRPFHFEKEPPFAYKRADWAGPMYLAMLGNTGVLNCYGAPPFEGKGALAKNDPKYKGEIFVAEGAGKAKLAAWTPNSATISLDGVTSDVLVAYNMNYDAGWSSSAGKVESFGDRVAVRLPAGTSEVTLRYRPRGFLLSVIAGLAALVGIVLGIRKEWRAEQGREIG